MSINVANTTEANVKRQLTVGASQVAGDVILISEMPVYLLEASDSNNKAVCHILGCSLVINADVTGADGVGNTAIALGDALYKDGTEINADATNGTKIGYALAAVSSGATTEIEVALTG